MADELKFKISGDSTEGKNALVQAQQASRDLAITITQLNAEVKAFTAIKIQNELDGFKKGASDAAREIRQLQVSLSEAKSTKLEVDANVKNLKSLGNESEAVFRQLIPNCATK